MSVAVATTYVFRRSHDWILQFLEGLSEEELRWVGGPGAPSIAFHAWHSARWADLLQSRLPGMAPARQKQLESYPQLWERDSLAQAWGLPSNLLGTDSTGMGMDDANATELTLPAKDRLLRYVREAFAAVTDAAGAVEEGQFSQPCTDLYGRPNIVAGVLLGHVTHLSRHLGMMEALKGVQGSRGTATV